MTARTRRRPGIATIEFVLVWPLLLMLCAGIFLIARAGIAKEAAASAARRAAFAARKTGAPGEVFLLTHDPQESRVSGAKSVRFTPGPLFRGAAFAGESRGFTLDRTWDSRDAPFAPVGDWKIDPDPFKKVARNLPKVGDVIVAAINATLWALNPDANPALRLIASIVKVFNPIVRATAIALNVVMAITLGPARWVAKLVISWLPPWSGLKKKLKRVVGLIDILGTAVDNLDNASRGKPVDQIGGMGRVRRP